ncbi:uncharacterized protein G2W53_042365 [Senna tora]|uniref:Uncharacterized protein n=1 Tax=Senna tora TaxID=362788 RepID=A0A834W3R8_9FABA|nr:uncharacterized protein G2W53_042365 [Senna tora]
MEESLDLEAVAVAVSLRDLGFLPIDA